MILFILCFSSTYHIPSHSLLFSFLILTLTHTYPNTHFHLHMHIHTQPQLGKAEDYNNIVDIVLYIISITWVSKIEGKSQNTEYLQ